MIIGAKIEKKNAPPMMINDPKQQRFSPEEREKKTHEDGKPIKERGYQHKN